MVSGPTPPVIGVMAVRSVRFLISSEISPFKMPSSLAVPASTMMAPGFTITLEISPGVPVAVMIISYWLSFVKSEPR